MPFDTSPTTATGANHREYFAELCRELPPVPDEDPEARAARQNSAMDAVVALHPDNAFEARLAVRIVSTDAHAADALRSAALAAGDPERVRQCRAQVASMARHSDAALRALLRIQATREKQEAAMHPAAMGRAGYWFKEVSAAPGPDRDPGPAPDHDPGPTPARPKPEPKPAPPDIDAEARLYAALYPERVARIREAGGLPPRLDFGPPEPAIVAALLRGAVPPSEPQSRKSTQ
jgi:hypothetical protein